MTLELPVDVLILTGALLLLAGVLSSAFADRVRVPGLLLFLALGMLIGDDGLDLVSLSDPGLAQTFGVLALIVILYEGGLTTKPSDLRRAAVPGLGLATLGVVLTAGVVAAAVLLLTDLGLITALLIGSVVSSTDAAAVFTVLRRAPLPRRITALLEVESGANDPMAIMLTVGVLEAWRSTPSAADWLMFGLMQLGGGLLIGAAVGVAGAYVLRRVRLEAAGLYPVLALAVAGLGYGAATRVGASGFLAVYVTGLLVGALVPRHRRGIRTFHDGVANIAEIALFLLLGILVFPADLITFALPALALSAVLVLVARPFAVHATMVWPLLRGRWDMRELGLVSWSGLRGAVPIVLATFPLTAAYPDGETIFNIVFFVVLISTAVQGSTVGLVSRMLGFQVGSQRWAPVAEALPLEGLDIDLVEVDVVEGLHVEGRRLRDVPLPAGALLTAVVRRDAMIVPTGETRLQVGDHALVAVTRRPTATEEIVAWARGETWPPARPPHAGARPARQRSVPPDPDAAAPAESGLPVE